MKRSGLDEFKELLGDFKGLSGWAVGTSLAAPFVSAFLDIAPPWPKGIVPFTSIAELITLAFIYQFFPRLDRKTCNRLMTLSIILITLFLCIYFFLFSQFTFEIPATNTRGVRGFVCTEEAHLVYGEKCNLKSFEALESSEYEVDILWKNWSVSMIKISLVVSWLLPFCALSIYLGIFILYQRRTHNS